MTSLIYFLLEKEEEKAYVRKIKKQITKKIKRYQINQTYRGPNTYEKVARYFNSTFLAT